MTDRLQKRLMLDEGRVMVNGLHVPYRDSEGYLTIGYGCLIDEDKRGGLHDNEAEFILKNRIRLAKIDCIGNFPWFSSLDDVRKDVVINMVFNMGIGTFLGFKKTIEHIRAGDYHLAAEEMLDSKWARQVGSRADRLSDMMKTGVYP